MLVKPDGDLVVRSRPRLVDLGELRDNLVEAPTDGQSETDGVIPSGEVTLRVWRHFKQFTDLVVDGDEGGGFFRTFFT